MSRRQKQYADLLAACRNQSTGWLARCNAEPGPYQNAVSRLAVRTVLRERTPSFPVDIDRITEYGITSRLSRAVRVY